MSNIKVLFLLSGIPPVLIFVINKPSQNTMYFKFIFFRNLELYLFKFLSMIGNFVFRFCWFVLLGGDGRFVSPSLPVETLWKTFKRDPQWTYMRQARLDPQGDSPKGNPQGDPLGESALGEFPWGIPHGGCPWGIPMGFQVPETVDGIN